MATKCIETESAELVELKTVTWASSLLEDKGWKKLDYTCDAKRVVDMVSDRRELTYWWYRNDIIEVKSRFFRFNWVLEWTARERNSGAEAVAKY